MKLSSNSTLQLIPLSNLSHVTKKVTEEISQKHLKSFFQTALIQANLKIEKNTKVFYSFIKEVNLYEIYIFQTTEKNPLLEIQLFENYQNFDETLENKYTLFITNKSFAIYLNKKVILAFENKNYQESDILKFIQFTYKITIAETIMIADEEFNKLKQNTSNLKPLHYINLANSYEHYYFLVYLVVLIVSSLYFYTISYTQTIPKAQTEIKQEQPYNNQKIALKFTQFIEKLNSKNIKLEDLSYDKKLCAKIQSNNQNLYDFLAIYKKDMKIIKLEKIDDNLIFAEVEIEF